MGFAVRATIDRCRFPKGTLLGDEFRWNLSLCSFADLCGFALNILRSAPESSPQNASWNLARRADIMFHQSRLMLRVMFTG